MNLNKTIVALYSMDGQDLSVKASKLRNNIRHGRQEDPVGEIPAAYIPDFAALHAEEAAMGPDAFAAAWADFEARRQEHYDALVDLWEAQDYAGMVTLLDRAEEADG